MKRIFLIVLLALCTVSTMNIQAQDYVPPYGVTVDGDYFVRKDVAKKCCTGPFAVTVNGDKVNDIGWDGGWQKCPLYEYKGVDVYVYQSGIALDANKETTFCFELVAGCFFPTAGEKNKISDLVLSDIVKNYGGNGYNLQMKPVPFRFLK